MIVLYLTLCVCFVYFINYFWSRRRLYLLAWKLPGPIAYPLFGNVLTISNPNDLLQIVGKMRKHFKSNFRLWLGSKLVVYIHNLDDIQRVLTDPECLDKGDFYKFIGHIFGTGILVSQKEKWAKNRKLINPSFRQKHLIALFSIFNYHLDILAAFLKTKLGQGEFCVADNVLRTNFDLSYETAFGAKPGMKTLSNESMLQAHHDAKYIASARIFWEWFHLDWILRFSKHVKTQESSTKVLMDYNKMLVESRLASFEEKSLENEKADGTIQESCIFLDHALKLYKEQKFSWTDVCYESNIIFAAASDTTAHAIVFIIQCLAMYPEWQDKVYEELLSMYPSKEFEVTYQDAKNMVICDLVINEALRLFPPVVLMSRSVSGDVHLTKNVILPKGTLLIMDVFHTHRDPDIWGPTATTFDPTRFISNNLSNIHPCGYLPFSKGARNCIGLRYANLALKVYMAKIFRSYYFTTKQKLEDFHFRVHVTAEPLIDPIIEIYERS